MFLSIDKKKISTENLILSGAKSFFFSGIRKYQIILIIFKLAHTLPKQFWLMSIKLIDNLAQI